MIRYGATWLQYAIFLKELMVEGRTESMEKEKFFEWKQTKKGDLCLYINYKFTRKEMEGPKKAVVEIRNSQLVPAHKNLVALIFYTVLFINQ